MKPKQALPKLLLLTLLLCTGVGIVFATVNVLRPDQWDYGFRVDSSTSDLEVQVNQTNSISSVTTDCYQVTNPGGDDLFIPTKTRNEWDAFASNSGVTVGPCGDGELVLASGSNINSDLIASGRSYADGIAYRIATPVGAVTSVSRYSASDTLSNGLAPGDTILIINLKGTNADYGDVGHYHFRVVDTVTADTITFTPALIRSFDGASPTSQKVVVQRVPTYSNVTLASGATLTAGAWDDLTTTPSGTAGYQTGVVVFRSTGPVDVQAGGTIDVAGLGMSGGASRARGESVGANAWAGGAGSNGGTCNNGNPGGGGDHSGDYGMPDLSKIYHGSGGGGGGHSQPCSGGGAPGSDGGGIVMMLSDDTITVNGSITADGNATAGRSGNSSGCGMGCPNLRGGYSGGGAGGSIYLRGTSVSLGTGLVTADAPNGAWIEGDTGRIAVYHSSTGSVSGTTVPTSNNYTY